MSVDIYVYRPDIPEDCVRAVCEDEYYGPFDRPEYAQPERAYRFSVSYWNARALCEKYPALDYGYLNGKTGRDIMDELGKAAVEARMECYREPQSVEGHASRMNLVSNLANLAGFLIVHPDWKVMVRS